jgi:hypothetical protein
MQTGRAGLMRRRKSGIFNALEGGHLDAALFGADASKAKSVGETARTDKPTLPRRSRLGWRGKTSATERGETRST